MDILATFERHWFLISILIVLLVYWFGVVTEVGAITPGIIQIFYAGTGRNASGNFAAYPTTPK